MNKSSLVSIWILFLITIFCTMYLLTGYLVSRVMADFSEPTSGLTTLKVEPSTGTQSDQYTPIQPSVTPIGKEL